VHETRNGLDPRRIPRAFLSSANLPFAQLAYYVEHFFRLSRQTFLRQLFQFARYRTTERDDLNLIRNITTLYSIRIRIERKTSFRFVFSFRLLDASLAEATASIEPFEPFEPFPMLSDSFPRSLAYLLSVARRLDVSGSETFRDPGDPDPKDSAGRA